MLQGAYPYIRSLMVLLIGILGCFVFGMIGSMTYPGIGAIGGAVIGFFVFGIVGCIVVGKWKDIIPDGLDPTDMVPHAVAGAVGSHGHFTLFITVHRAEEVNTNAGIMGLFGGSNDSYVSVECGINPVKATCVRRDNVWQETFRVQVRPKDTAVTFNLMDQDVIGDDLVGTVSVDIDDDIVHQGFPQEKQYRLETGGKDKSGKAKLVLSFDYGDDLGGRKIAQVQTSSQKNYDARQTRHQNAVKEWNKYGTFAPGSAGSLASLHFNTDPRLTMDLAAKLQQGANQDGSLQEGFEQRAPPNGPQAAGAGTGSASQLV